MNKIYSKIQEFSTGKVNLKNRIVIMNYDEIGLIVSGINQMMENLEKHFNEINQSVKEINRQSGQVSDSSSQLFKLSDKESGAVNEIVQSMEISEKYSLEVSSNIQQVVEITKETKNSVKSGVNKLKTSLENTGEIQNANQYMIHEIKDLNDKIKGIWDILTIINNIADQTKIIAFNAELEASSAGNSGKNFEIVAGEIRRLADNTTSSTLDIRNKIKEIENSSEKLIQQSEKGTEIIKQESALSDELKKIFDTIQKNSEISADSTNLIYQHILKQVDSIKSISNALKQIQISIADLRSSSSTASISSEELRKIAGNLYRIADQYS